MAGLALVASRNARPVDRTVARTMAAAAPHRGHAEFTSSASDSAVAAALGAGVATAGDGAGRLIVADARLDDRADLTRRLGASDAHRNDAALILAAFERWGDECADQLRGDFAFVIWDAPRSELFAARDLFGMRPFFYTLTDGQFLAASEIAQILAAPGVAQRIDERSVLAALTGRTQSPRWTFFEGVQRLRPGHVLRVDGGGARSREFWHPQRHPDGRGLRGADYAAELRGLHEAAVESRLRASDAPGLMLSGGIDSMSIAATAAARRAGDVSIPALATYSFAYDRFADCDERRLSDQIVATTGQTNTAVPTDDTYPFANYHEVTPDLDGPDLLQSHVTMQRTLTLAHEDGVKLMMTGQHGDSLFGGGIHDYLGVLVRGGPFDLLSQFGEQGQREGSRRRAVLKRELLGRLTSAAWPRYRWTRARDLLRRVAPGGAERPPWIRADALTTHHLETAAADAVPVSSLSGDARRRRHEAILSTSYAASAEYLERIFAHTGIRYADPWADRSIADWLLTVPQHAITREGEHKWLLREAVRGVLSDYARSGRFQATPGPFYEYGVLEGSAAAVQELLTDPLTAQRGYVDPAVLTSTYARYQGGHWPGLGEWSAFWRWLTIERWLRVHAR